MDFSIDYNLYSASNHLLDKARYDELQEKIRADNTSDEELKEVCKSFEVYLLEQVFTKMKDAVSNDDDKNPYLEQFEGLLYKGYAESVTEGEGIGIAQMLYEAMKKN